jgi:hypothetical protein
MPPATPTATGLKFKIKRASRPTNSHVATPIPGTGASSSNSQLSTYKCRRIKTFFFLFEAEPK